MDHFERFRFQHQMISRDPFPVFNRYKYTQTELSFQSNRFLKSTLTRSRVSWNHAWFHLLVVTHPWANPQKHQGFPIRPAHLGLPFPSKPQMVFGHDSRSRYSLSNPQKDCRRFLFKQIYVTQLRLINLSWVRFSLEDTRSWFLVKFCPTHIRIAVVSCSKKTFTYVHSYDP